MFALYRAPMVAMIAAVLTIGGRCSEDATNSSNASSASSASNVESGPAPSSKIEANLTDLPTYPNLTSGSMMGHPPTQGALYSATTNDSYDQVVTWYRAHLAGAREEHSKNTDGFNGQREIEFHLPKWNEQVVILADSAVAGTKFTLGQDAHQ